MMIKLRDKETGAQIGSITEEQLRFMVDQLEEEFEEDRDYYLNAETLELFEQNGADPGLMALLRKAMAGREEMEIAWSRS